MSESFHENYFLLILERKRERDVIIVPFCLRTSQLSTTIEPAEIDHGYLFNIKHQSILKKITIEELFLFE